MTGKTERPLALVTGASGFIGSHLAEGLLREGFRVRALVRRDSSPRWLAGLDLELARGGYDDPDSLEKAADGANYIFHAAAAKSGSHQLLRRANVEPPLNLARAALRANPGLNRFVFLSSQAAAGPADSLGAPKRESDPCRPLSDYGRSKLEAEMLLAKIEGLPLTVIRPPTVYGPRDRDVWLYFKWVDRGIALLPGLRERYANLIYVPDLVTGTIMAATAEEALGGTYFLSDPQAYSWSQISQAIARALGRRPVSLRVPLFLARFSALLAEGGARLAGREAIFNRQKAYEMAQLCWSCAPWRAGDDFGFACRNSLEEGLAQTARWYRDNGWL